MRTDRTLVVSILALSTALLGCKIIKDQLQGGSDDTTAADAGATAVAAPGGSDHNPQIEVGAQVLASWMPTAFREGTVTAVAGDQITYEYGTSTKRTHTVANKDAYVIGPSHQTKAGPGQFAMCRSSKTFWEPCEIKSIEGSLLKAIDDDGDEHNLDRKDVVLPNPTTQAALAKWVKKEQKRKAFVDEAKAAGTPEKRGDWRPRTGELVFARFGTAWSQGTVTKKKNTGWSVRFKRSKTESFKRIEDMAPIAKKPATPAPGQLVIAEPAGSGIVWSYYRVDSVSGDSAQLTDQHGKPRTVKTSAVVPLVK